MTEQELNALVAGLAALEAAATPAPWTRSGIGAIEGPANTPVAQEVYDGDEIGLDATLIVNARNTLPMLLSALQAARIQAAELRTAIDRTRAYVDHPGNWSALDGRRRTILALLGGDG
ncbi:hypothetical protein GS462_11100 [Rhodococcus hoagii]|nr:hypothetical protein [Prescottella equi]MBM4650959.1 hypothetical protein [Prescottella equi]MBM4686694.1 hypothetical protein [Prescottella equi]